MAVIFRPQDSWLKLIANHVKLYSYSPLYDKGYRLICCIKFNRMCSCSVSGTTAPLGPAALARLIAGHISLHACMAGMRMAAPLMAPHAGHSAR